MLKTEYIAGVRLTLKSGVQEWAYFAKSLQQLLDPDNFLRAPASTALARGEKKAQLAGQIMRAMELTFVSSSITDGKEFSKEVAKARELLYPRGKAAADNKAAGDEETKGTGEPDLHESAHVDAEHKEKQLYHRVGRPRHVQRCCSNARSAKERKPQKHP